MSVIFGECDNCGADNRVLHKANSSAGEAYACAECRGGLAEDDAWEIEEEIEEIEGKLPAANRRLAALKAELARINGEEHA